MRPERIVPGRTPPARLAGAILTRDLTVAGQRVPKGTRLDQELVAAIAAGPGTRAVTVLVPEDGEVHEDEAGLRLATAVAGGDPGVTLRGPARSRVDLIAAVPGVVEVRVAALERLNRIDLLEVFTVLDGQSVEPGELVASIKVAPHLVPEAILASGEAVARRAAPLVRVAPFRPARIAVLVKGDEPPAARARFEAAIRAKATGLRAQLTAIRYVDDEVAAVTAALRSVTRGPRADRADIVLTAGSASTDPTDAAFVAIESLGGRMVRRGVPAHPGSMLWLARIGRVTVVGLPSCGAYSMATAADLLLPRLVAGQPASATTVARLAHGGILARSQRFRFPAYARALDAPDG